MTNFDSLPNELILDVFEYIDGVQLLISFYGLNSHLNKLLNESFKSYNFDFRFISKSNWNTIYEKHFPMIFTNIKSLHLSDDDETPNLPEIFLSNYIKLHQFINLNSLSLHLISSKDIIKQILEQCSQLPNLTSLKLIECTLNREDYEFLNKIWNLTRLTNFHLDQVITNGINFSNLSAQSTSIKYLSIKNMTLNINDLLKIFQQTPYLRHLSIKLLSKIENEKFEIEVPHLIKLTLSFSGSISTLTNLLKNFNKLHSLTIEMSLLVNGCQWEKILTDYLVHLKTFQLKMNFNIQGSNDNIESQVHELLQTFQTDFWLNIHQWFVRCDWISSSSTSLHARLYTLPYAFSDFHIRNKCFSLSTSQNNASSWLYENVKHLQYQNSSTYKFEYFPIQFTNISHLEIILPSNENFLLHIPILNNLNSLDVTLLPGHNTYEQLRSIIIRAPRLYLLRFSHLSELDDLLFHIPSISIRRVEFFTKQSMIYNWYFNEEECHTLANSSLGKQCRTLAIDLKSRTHIIDLVNKMHNLTSLTFQCKDDKTNKTLPENDELIQWLNEHLPTPATIQRDKNQISLIRLWIR